MKNGTAKIIFSIGMCILILGIIGSFILGSKSNNWFYVIVGILSSIMSSFLFIGFAEIIELLQKNLDQSKIMGNILVSTKVENKKTNQIDELPEL